MSGILVFFYNVFKYNMNILRYYWFARGSGGGDEIGGDSRFFWFSRLQK